MREAPAPASRPAGSRATAAHAAGDFVGARELARELVAAGDPSLEVLRGLVELEYLPGDYGRRSRCCSASWLKRAATARCGWTPRSPSA